MSKKPISPGLDEAIRAARELLEALERGAEQAAGVGFGEAARLMVRVFWIAEYPWLEGKNDEE